MGYRPGRLCIGYAGRSAGRLRPWRWACCVAFTTYITPVLRAHQRSGGESTTTFNPRWYPADRVYRPARRRTRAQEDAGRGRATAGTMRRARSSSGTCGSPTRGRTGCCVGVSFVVEKGREDWPLWGRPARGRPPSSSCFTHFYPVQKGADPHRRRAPRASGTLGALRQAASAWCCRTCSSLRGHGGGQRAHLTGPFRAEQVLPGGGKRSTADGFVDAPAGGHGRPGWRNGAATFSSGERQLLSFARAIAHDPRRCWCWTRPRPTSIPTRRS